MPLQLINSESVPPRPHLRSSGPPIPYIQIAGHDGGAPAYHTRSRSGKKSTAVMTGSSNRTSLTQGTSSVTSGGRRRAGGTKAKTTPKGKATKAKAKAKKNTKKSSKEEAQGKTTDTENKKAKVKPRWKAALQILGRTASDMSQTKSRTSRRGSVSTVISSCSELPSTSKAEHDDTQTENGEMSKTRSLSVLSTLTSISKLPSITEENEHDNTGDHGGVDNALELTEANELSSSALPSPLSSVKTVSPCSSLSSIESRSIDSPAWVNDPDLNPMDLSWNEIDKIFKEQYANTMALRDLNNRRLERLLKGHEHGSEETSGNGSNNGSLRVDQGRFLK
ncbi:hypothetical protein K435DRAFT_838357 [Dendrothele bispora CBS 962.96]|uniref:Uncharacterized protein n=1 Tax=Dendrothele bispora (strain CBS 962.96) TaxID=1314807 RepID=A0A4S8M6M8_DENBC|nr:hypothetical protein K435DRAFT_838357 [Dendrothele bispora CBS 962.96]